MMRCPRCGRRMSYEDYMDHAIGCPGKLSTLLVVLSAAGAGVLLAYLLGLLT